MQTFSVKKAWIWNINSNSYSIPDPNFGNCWWYIPVETERVHSIGTIRDERHHAINRCTHIKYSPLSQSNTIYLPFKCNEKGIIKTCCSSFAYWQGHTGAPNDRSIPDTWMVSRPYFGCWIGHFGYALTPSYVVGPVEFRISMKTPKCRRSGFFNNFFSGQWSISLDPHNHRPITRDNLEVKVIYPSNSLRDRLPNFSAYLEKLKLLITEIYFQSFQDAGLPNVDIYCKSLQVYISDIMTKLLDHFEFDVNQLTEPLSGNLDQWGTRDSIGDTFPDIDSAFMFHEYDRIWEGLSPLTFERGTLSTYWFNWLVQHAFLDACSTVPRLNDNMISNVLEIFDFMRDLKHGEVKIPRSLSDAWLAYRYSLGTSILDAEEAITFVTRNMDVPNYGVWKGYGISKHTYHDIEVTVRCVLYVSPNNYNSLANAWRDISSLGFAPDLYQIWDSLPYSFIVDWFIPIGDVLNVTDQSVILTEENYSFSHICYTITYKRGNIKCFSRWSEKHPPELNGFYWFDKETDPTFKTTVFRCIDAASLIQGAVRRKPERSRSE